MNRHDLDLDGGRSAALELFLSGAGASRGRDVAREEIRAVDAGGPDRLVALGGSSDGQAEEGNVVEHEQDPGHVGESLESTVLGVVGAVEGLVVGGIGSGGEPESLEAEGPEPLNDDNVSKGKEGDEHNGDSGRGDGQASGDGSEVIEDVEGALIRVRSDVDDALEVSRDTEDDHSKHPRAHEGADTVDLESRH